MACVYGVSMKCIKGRRSKNAMGESMLENPSPKGTALPPIVHSLKYLPWKVASLYYVWHLTFLRPKVIPVVLSFLKVFLLFGYKQVGPRLVWPSTVNLDSSPFPGISFCPFARYTGYSQKMYTHFNN